MERKLVTIVVPIYNVERYLEKCLTSIILQTYKNLEIILINDGSTDSSLNICKEFEKEDGRIRIISQENKGLSVARNVGIENANGEYIAFIDSDDFVSCKFIENLYNELIRNNSDIVCCDFYYVNELEKKWALKEKENKIYNSIEALKDILIGERNTEIKTWNKLYRLDLFKKYDIRFPVGKINEDYFTTYKLYYYSNTISLIKDRLYYNLQRKNNIMNTKFDTRKLNILDSISDIRHFFSNKTINLEDEIEAYEYYIKIDLLNSMIVEKVCKTYKNNLVKSLKRKSGLLIKNKCLSVNYKISLLIIKISFGLYSKLLLLKNKIKSNYNS